MTDAQPQVLAIGKHSLVTKFASRYSIESNKLLETLKQTAFKQQGNKPISNEQMAALLVVADQYGLNPFTREIYAFPNQTGAIVPIVGLDGWSRIINSQDAFDGMEFNDVGETSMVGKRKRDCPAGIECIIYRKDREHPTRITEWISECHRETNPWDDMPRRMLRHKALVQCARLAFAFVGIYDEDEAQRIIEGEVVSSPPSGGHTDGSAGVVNEALKPGGVDLDGVEVSAHRHGGVMSGESQTTGEIEDAEIVEDDADGEENGLTAYAGEAGTKELVRIAESAETLEELDMVRSINAQRTASPADKSIAMRALSAKVKALSGATDAK